MPCMKAGINRCLGINLFIIENTAFHVISSLFLASGKRLHKNNFNYNWSPDVYDSFRILSAEQSSNDYMQISNSYQTTKISQNSKIFT